MIALNEPTAALRRVLFGLANENGDPLAGVVLTGSDLQLGKNCGALANFAGSVVEVGGGLYYYEHTLDEVDTAGFNVFRVVKSGVKTSVFAELIIGDAMPTPLRIPVYLTNAIDVAVTSFVPAAGELQATANGATIADAMGTWVEVAFGIYYYECAAADESHGGFLGIKIASAGIIQPQLIAEDFHLDGIGLGGGDPTPPVVSVVSPSPFVAPGDPGGFSSDPAVAKVTPIVLLIADLETDLQYVCVTASFGGSESEEVVYRRGAFRGAYLASTEEAVDDDVTLTILRAGGWPTNNDGTISTIRFAVDAIDADGSLTVGDGAMNIKLNGTLVGSTDTLNFVGLDVTEEDGIVTVEAEATDVAFSGASVYNTATQNIGSGAGVARTFDAESYDTDGYHDNAVNPTRLTIPVGGAGYYFVHSTVRLLWGSGTYRDLSLYVNGTFRRRQRAYPSGTLDTFWQVSGVFLLAAGDYVETYVEQNSGGGLPTELGEQYSFQIHRIGL